MKEYFHNIAIALSQLLNALTGGYPDETFSSRAWRERDTHPLRVKLLDWMLGDNHCYNTWNWERMDMHSPEEFRNQ